MITFIRHAEALHNVQYTQQTNTSLTDKGIKQANNLSGNYDIVICSPLLRTRQTLDFSNIIYKDLIFLSSCREVLNGAPCNYYNGEEIIIESRKNIMNRLSILKIYLEEKSKNNNICVISHHDILYELTGRYLKNCEKIIIPFNKLL